MFNSSGIEVLSETRTMRVKVPAHELVKLIAAATGQEPGDLGTFRVEIPEEDDDSTDVILIGEWHDRNVGRSSTSNGGR